MNFGQRQTDTQDINITPLIDVVFILLIFFMVTTTFQREADLSVNLPEASQEPEPPTEWPLEIVITSSGEYYLGGQQLPNSQAGTLKQALRKLTAGQQQPALVIRADANTAHQYVITAMDVAAQLGLSKLSIATTQAPD